MMEKLDKRHQTPFYKIVSKLKTIGGKFQEPNMKGETDLWVTLRISNCRSALLRIWVSVYSVSRVKTTLSRKITFKRSKESGVFSVEEHPHIP